MSERIIQNWLRLAEYDLTTARSMLKEGRYLYVAFTCQQAVEKALKAIHVKNKKNTPPYTHNLAKLIHEAGIESPPNTIFIEELTSYYLESRYTEEIDAVEARLTKDVADEILKHAEELFSWLRMKI
ncbi:MAG: HEPN domain-containing protein [Spirochaetota bacterium]